MLILPYRPEETPNGDMATPAEASTPGEEQAKAEEPAESAAQNGAASPEDVKIETPTTGDKLKDCKSISKVYLGCPRKKSLLWGLSDHNFKM